MIHPTHIQHHQHQHVPLVKEDYNFYLAQGLIFDKRVLVGKRMTRIYYHLETAGAVRFRELVQEYEDVVQRMRPMTFLGLPGVGRTLHSFLRLDTEIP